MTSAYNTNSYNNLITDLSCFSALESAGYVNIQKQAALVSFEGLKKVINKLEGEDSWTVSENAYNPTFEQVKAGELVKQEQIKSLEREKFGVVPDSSLLFYPEVKMRHWTECL